MPLERPLPHAASPYLVSSSFSFFIFSALLENNIRSLGPLCSLLSFTATAFPALRSRSVCCGALPIVVILNGAPSRVLREFLPNLGECDTCSYFRLCTQEGRVRRESGCALEVVFSAREPPHKMVGPTCVVKEVFRGERASQLRLRGSENKDMI